jgi:hypothetical protein
LAVQTAAVPLNLLPFAAIPTNRTAPTCSLANLGLTGAVFSLSASLQWMGNEKRLSNSTRGSDVATRWAGDEFMMLLVDCEVEQLSRVLLRLEGFEVQVNGKTLPVSVAAGWKAYEPEDREEELIEAADRRLCYNKEVAKKREPAAVAEVQ